ncbi:MAG: hypothetical protein Q8K85_10495, partial [Hyphomicrobium sp.]|nr:hypothetical protein [Hyphomicrobium sp.]
MSRGGRVARIVVAAAVCAAAPTMAFAAKLDKAACAELATELNAIAGTGIKSEMERGPEWAKANMPPERLQSARRLIEIEDQLEFRCGVRGKGKPAEQTATSTPAAGTPPGSGPAATPPPNAVEDSTKAAEQPASRVAAEPPAAGQRTTAPANLAPVIKPPVPLQPTHVVPAPPAQRTSAGPAVISPAAAAPVAPPAAASPPAAPQAVKAPVTAVARPAAPSAAKPQQPAPLATTTPSPAQTAAVRPVEDNVAPAAASIGPTPGGPLPAVKKPGDP